MDEEMNPGFAIPGKKPMFGEGPDEGFGGTELFKAYANEAGDKAVVLATVDAMADEGEEHIPDGELESYAQEVIDGGDDYRDLKIGDVYEGETAKADADAEAGRLDEEYNPGEGATIDELVSAIDDAKSDTTVDEENALAEEEAEPTSFGAPDTEAERELPPLDNEPEDEEVSGEPMLDQLKKAKKPY